jgi:hypothetical protein
MIISAFRPKSSENSGVLVPFIASKPEILLNYVYVFASYL